MDDRGPFRERVAGAFAFCLTALLPPVLPNRGIETLDKDICLKS